jgi:hypothetical protein
MAMNHFPTPTNHKAWVEYLAANAAKDPQMMTAIQKTQDQLKGCILPTELQ